MSSNSENKPFRLYPMVCGLMIGSMPAMLWLPLIGRLMRWVLGNGYFMAFFIFTNYLPWMIGFVVGRALGFPTLIPVIFCFLYWLILGMIAGEPKYTKTVRVYIATAHLLIPFVFYLTFIRPMGDLSL